MSNTIFDDIDADKDFKISEEELSDVFDLWIEPYANQKRHFEQKVNILYSSFDSKRQQYLTLDSVLTQSLSPRDELTGHNTNRVLYYHLLQSPGFDTGIKEVFDEFSKYEETLIQLIKAEAEIEGERISRAKLAKAKKLKEEKVEDESQYQPIIEATEDDDDSSDGDE